MGFFKKLFEKKECDLCGGEIGLLGNRKLEDGNMCKDCAKKLSPWFSERRSSTIEQIREQLAYREENYRQLQDFRVENILGDYNKMYIEEVNGIPTRFYVTDARDPMEANPDIIAFKDVITCVTDIRNTRNELKRKNANGEMVSYSPPKYEYTYQFQIEMTIRNNPYFDSIRFQVHSFPVRVTMEERSVGFLGAALGVREMEPTYDHAYQKCKKLCEQIEQIVADGKHAAMAAPVAQEAVAEEPETVSRPSSCPVCGAPAGEGKFCEYCGAKL